MAFTWEVEALRKILDTILEGGEAQERYDFGKDLLEKSKKGQAKKSDAAIRDERIAREQFELGPDDPLPARWEVDSDGFAWDLTPFDWQEEQREKAREDRQVVGDIESENRGRSPAIDAFLDALSNVPADEARRRERESWTSDPNDPRNYEWEDQGAFDYELDRYLSGKGDLASTRGKGAIKEWGMQDIHELEEKQWKEFKKDSKDKLKLDWVNEILKEFPEDKAPEVLRLPHLKDEDRTGMSPFLSYLLRQSPYARLPAAGLLGLGLMGYSKPAY